MSETEELLRRMRAAGAARAGEAEELRRVVEYRFWNDAVFSAKVKRAVMAAEVAFGLPVDVDLPLMRLTAGVAVLLAERDEATP